MNNCKTVTEINHIFQMDNNNYISDMNHHSNEVRNDMNHEGTQFGNHENLDVRGLHRKNTFSFQN